MQNNTFLQNAGIVSGKPRSSAKSVQARLEVEIRANGDLRSVVSNQRVEIEVLSKQLQGNGTGKVKGHGGYGEEASCFGSKT